MARLSRVEIFAPDEVAIVHVMNRTVRRCFLLGIDPLTGKNFDHRKVWLDDELKRLAAQFGIDLLCQAIMSNHFHLVLRSRPDVVEAWSDSEVARRWLMLCPLRKDDQGRAKVPNEFELNSIRNDPVKLATMRGRLSDISWWMRLLSQNIAQRANKEDEEVGKFWQARYRAVRLLDAAAVLACAAYVDLNPIRAAMAETLEASDFTSVQKRLAAMVGEFGEVGELGLSGVEESLVEEGVASGDAVLESGLKKVLEVQAVETEVVKVEVSNVEVSNVEVSNVEVSKAGVVGEAFAMSRTASLSSLSPDAQLARLSIDELNDAIGPCVHVGGQRASDKGFLPMTTAAYVDLLDWTARQIRADKCGATPATMEPVFERLGISGEVWCGLVKDFGRMFYAVAGRPHEIDAHRSRNGQRRYKTRRETRELMVV